MLCLHPATGIIAYYYKSGTINAIVLPLIKYESIGTNF